MQLQQALAPAAARTKQAIQDLTQFAKLERVLAGICALTPLMLIAAGPAPIRESISAYYNIAQNQWFYVPLTMAAMLFVVNGVVKNKQLYNTYLGAMLGGVLLFNHTDHSVLHIIFAAAFFVGNALVILLFSSVKDREFKIALVAFIGLALVGWYIFDWFTLFVAEWVSLAIIAIHYIIESKVDGDESRRRAV
jgi:hypothetical protein